MSSTVSAAGILDRVYLEVRCKLLDVAACLDRVDRGDDAAAATKDPRYEQLRRGIEILHGAGPDRAEQIQLLFSDAYEAHWNKKSAATGNGKR